LSTASLCLGEELRDEALAFRIVNHATFGYTLRSRNV
jgi:hypothetical protein